MDAITLVALYLQVVSLSFGISLAVYVGNQIVRKARIRGTINVDDAAVAVSVAVMVLADLGVVWVCLSLPR